MPKLRAIAALCALGALACQGTPQKSPAPTPSQPQAKGEEPLIVISNRPATGAEGTEGPAASKVSIKDSNLFVHVRWPEVTGQHTQRLSLYAPNGSLMTVLRTSFKGNGKPMWVSSSYPFANTGVREFGMAGGWRVEAALDGGASQSTSRFTIAGE
jgi:hypothetical protein